MAKPDNIPDAVWADVIRELTLWDKRFDGAETTASNILEVLHDAGLIVPARPARQG